MNIIFTLDEKSIDNAIKQVREYRDDFHRKMQTVCEKLAQIGMKVMQEKYSGALYAGVNDIDVSVDVENSSATITAKGQTVAFIEFGTGVKYAEPPHLMNAGIPKHGTYGKRKGATGKPWIYEGEPGNLGTHVKNRTGVYWTDGNPAAAAIPVAMDEMRNSIMDVIREVFK